MQKRTQLDILLYALEASCGPGAVEAFKRDMLPHLRLSEKARQEITEAEFQSAIQNVGKELPNFLKWLRGPLL
jgi:hypothetical protein